LAQRGRIAVEDELASRAQVGTLVRGLAHMHVDRRAEGAYTGFVA
jgi:hypothetical protein